MKPITLGPVVNANAAMHAMFATMPSVAEGIDRFAVLDAPREDDHRIIPMHHFQEKMIQGLVKKFPINPNLPFAVDYLVNSDCFLSGQCRQGIHPEIRSAIEKLLNPKKVRP